MAILERFEFLRAEAIEGGTNFFDPFRLQIHFTHGAGEIHGGIHAQEEGGELGELAQLFRNGHLGDQFINLCVCHLISSLFFDTLRQLSRSTMYPGSTTAVPWAESRSIF